MLANKPANKGMRQIPVCVLAFVWLGTFSTGAAAVNLQSVEDLIQEGRFDEARKILADDASLRSTYLLGHIYFHEGAGGVLNIDYPGDSIPRGDSRSRGNFPYKWDYWRGGNYPKARDYYKVVWNDQEASQALRAKARFWYALSHQYEGNFEEAKRHFQNLLECEDLDPRLVYFAGRFIAEGLLHQRQWHKAREAYVQLIGSPIRPLHRNAAISMLEFAWRSELAAARAALRRGEAAATVDQLKAFFREQPLPEPDLPDGHLGFRMRPRDHAEGMLLLGDAHAALGNDAKAVAAWEQVGARRAPASDDDFLGEAKLRLAVAALKQGDGEQAREHIDHALSLPALLPGTRKELLALASSAGLTADRHAWSHGGYGAEVNPTGQPIGGGLDYTDHVLESDWEVSTVAELLQALEEAEQMPFAERLGKVVFVAGEARLDLTEAAPVEVPDGITLAGNRGLDGCPGALLYYTRTKSVQVIRLGSDTRLTGLRIRGPAPDYVAVTDAIPEAYPPVGRGEKAKRDGEVNLGNYFGRNYPVTCVRIMGENATMDNCELSNAYSGVSVAGAYATIRHNWFHNISIYPIMIGTGHSTLIEANIIDWPWHAIATSSGMGTGHFEARYNIFREYVPNGYGQGMSGMFGIDAHAQGDRYLVHHNTFLFMEEERFGVPNRSIALSPPWEIGQIFRNRFVRPMSPEEAVFWTGRRRPVQDMVDLYDIVTSRDIHYHGRNFLRERYPGPEMRGFDFNQLAVTNRANDMEIGGFNFWIYDNAFGADDTVLPYTDYTTPRIHLISPQHRRPRSAMRGGRGGDLHPPLDVVAGNLEIDFEVSTVPGIGLGDVKVELIPFAHDWLYPWDWTRKFEWRETLWEGSEVSSPPGRLRLDTTGLANGVYGLLVTATDNRGQSTCIYTYFEVLNPGES